MRLSRQSSGASTTTLLALCALRSIPPVWKGFTDTGELWLDLSTSRTSETERQPLLSNKGFNAGGD